VVDVGTTCTCDSHFRLLAKQCWQACAPSEGQTQRTLWRRPIQRIRTHRVAIGSQSTRRLTFDAALCPLANALQRRWFLRHRVTPQRVCMQLCRLLFALMDSRGRLLYCSTVKGRSLGPKRRPKWSPLGSSGPATDPDRPLLNYVPDPICCPRVMRYIPFTPQNSFLQQSDNKDKQADIVLV
jgi:hypothetical protein